MADVMIDTDRERWETVLAQGFAIRPRWWHKDGRRYGHKPDYFIVMLGTRHNAVQLGWVFPREQRTRWEATLLVPQQETMTRVEQNNPRVNQEWRDRYRIELGEFETRKAAARALKEASLNRGMLRKLAEKLLSVVDVLAMIGDAA